MEKAELQYISDTLAMNRLEGLEKHAGIISSVFGGLLSSLSGTVSQFGQEKLNTDNPEDLVLNLLDMVGTGALFGFSPVLGIIYTIASEMFGFDLKKVAKDIINSIAPTLREGIAPTHDAITQATKNAISSQGGTAEASISLEYLTKFAGPLDALRSFFGKAGRRRSTSLFGGIIGWLIKTLLIGAGLKLGANFVENVGGKVKEEVLGPSSPESKPESSYEVVHQVEAPTKYQASGRGEQRFPNDDKNYWVVPLINGNIRDTLSTWVLDIYPDAPIYEVEKSSAFNRTVSMLQDNWKSESPGRLTMPKRFHSRKEVVDSFI